MPDITKDLVKAREQYHQAMAAAADHVLELLREQELLELVRWRLNGGAPAPMAKPLVTVTASLAKPKRGRAEGSKTCTWPGCSRPTKTAGLCGMHYQRRQRGAEMDGPSSRGRPRPRSSGPAATSAPAESPKEPAAAPAGKLDSPKVFTRAMLVRGVTQVQRGECKAFNRCSLIMKRRSVRQWTCGSCSGSSLGK